MRKPRAFACAVALTAALTAWSGRAQVTAFDGDASYPFAAFFPPSPPVYGVAMPESGPSTYSLLVQRPMQPPDELAEWVGEYFYPALGSRMFDGKLAKKFSIGLQAYRAARTALLDELANELDRLQTADRVTRERELRAFAPKQEARIAALEHDAEQLRSDLIRGGALGDSFEWNAGRSWRIGDSDLARDPLRTEAEYQVIRAAAFYQDGLRIEQRGWLRELAMDLMLKARVVRGRRPPPGVDPGAFFFSPEVARFHAPPKLPPALATKLGRFNHDKDVLKDELRQAVLDMDRSSGRKRAVRAAELAAQQAPGIGALEQLAEEIRSDLAALGEAPLPWLPPIPPALEQQIGLYAKNRDALVNELNAALDQAGVQPERPWYVVFALPLEKREQEMQERKWRARADRNRVAREFERQNAERINAVRALYDEIVAQAAVVARDLKNPQTGQLMTSQTLLIAHYVTLQRFDTIGREEVIYGRYKTAMLQPGLSPGQRRLLFTVAQVSLSQALPGGEDMSRARMQPLPQSTLTPN